LSLLQQQPQQELLILQSHGAMNFDCLILEILCVDNLNKIIDSTKTFSTQKIAANLARTLAHEVKKSFIWY
jgi:two-component system nitrogen regulation sensor histidine kinase GlnL